MEDLVLTIIAGPMKGRRLSIPSGRRLIFGRHDTSGGIALADNALSRKHCEIRHTKPGYATIVDFNSSNGTFVDSKRISGTVSIANGARIQFGSSVITVQLPEPPTEVDIEIKKKTSASDDETPVELPTLRPKTDVRAQAGAAQASAQKSVSPATTSNAQARPQFGLRTREDYHPRSRLNGAGSTTGKSKPTPPATEPAPCEICGSRISTLDILTGVAKQDGDMNICGVCIAKGRTIEDAHSFRDQKAEPADNFFVADGDDDDGVVSTDMSDSVRRQSGASREQAERMKRELLGASDAANEADEPAEDDEDVEYVIEYEYVEESELTEDDEYEIVESDEDDGDSTNIEVPSTASKPTSDAAPLRPPSIPRGLTEIMSTSVDFGLEIVEADDPEPDSGSRQRKKRQNASR